MGEYRTAQICLNGHLITYQANTNPEQTTNFCKKSGSQTLTHCQVSNETIRGRYYVPGVLGRVNYTIPNFCHGYGTSYPWTEATT